jgi:two-component system nitrate/nitrite sensor histidine kinase NarX
MGADKHRLTMPQASSRRLFLNRRHLALPGHDGALRRAAALWPLLCAAVAFVSALLLALAGGLHEAVATALPLLLTLGIGASVLAAYRLWRNLLQPLVELEDSLNRLCQGEPAARIGVAHQGALQKLVTDVQSLNEELTGLYDDMDDRVARQTRRLAQKTASLKILYEVAASINHADDLTELLIRYLRTLKEMVNGRSATVRLREADGRMRMMGSVAADNSVQLEHDMLPVTLCCCGRTLYPGEVLCEQDAQECSRCNGRKMYSRDEVESFDVPLQYHDELLGVYRIYVDKPGIAGREDILELLATIGSHLGMAVAKQRSDAEARRLSIIEERNHLAHELHDSIAQTLASLRFQVRMLQETQEKERIGSVALAETQKIRNGLDEAHTELRELLNSFRAPVDQRGLIPALQKLADHFRQETGLSIFCQCDCRQLQLSAHEEMQMLRVVQEALVNIRKHAQAHTVRILLRCRVPGAYMLLVEDDGVGFERPPLGGRPGEHIGLTIMEERARRIGAELRIESEPGEGTRVEMVFKPGRKIASLYPRKNG